MTIPIYQIDAFTTKVFKGNYAAVCLLRTWLKDEILQKIAKENNLSETAFIIQDRDKFAIRWFTPDIEMDLCGHATLATAHVIFEHLKYDKDEIHFTSASGDLKAFRKNDHIYLDFPARMPTKDQLPVIIAKGLSKLPKEVYKSRDYVLVYENEKEVANLVPDQKILDGINIDPGGIIATALSEEEDFDFISRFFTPQSTIFEDPVTGSAHCSLIPFWASILKKKRMKAKQISERGGELLCELKEDRVWIGGKCATYLKGEIYV